MVVTVAGFALFFIVAVTLCAGLAVSGAMSQIADWLEGKD